MAAMGFITQLSLLLAVGAALFCLGWFFVCVAGELLDTLRRRRPPTDEPDWDVVEETLTREGGEEGRGKRKLRLKTFDPGPTAARLSWFSSIGKPLDRD